MAKSKSSNINSKSASDKPETNAMKTLVYASGLIFSGTVILKGISTVPSLPSRKDFVVVLVDRGLRVNPVLGDLSGKMITVAANDPESLQLKDKAIFFTNSWIHGNGIAVKEMAHAGINEEKKVIEMVNKIPDFHLEDRLKDADLVALAEVIKIKDLERFSFERDYPFWKEAQLQIDEVLYGAPPGSFTLYFPTDDRPQWKEAPRFEEGQRGIFILHKPKPTSLSEASLKPGILLALDPADFQDESKLQEIKKLLKTISAKGGDQ